MKSFSVSDLQLIPELSGFNQIDFIDPKNDEVIAPFLKVLGYNLEYPVEYIACQHRNLKGEVIVGYVLVGEVNTSDEFINSSFATVEDRAFAAASKEEDKNRKDVKYGGCKLLSKNIKYLSSKEQDGAQGEAMPVDQLNSNSESITGYIKLLENLLLNIRGNPFKLDGSRKLLGEK